MDMLRHNHISNHIESITKMRFLQSILKQIPSHRSIQVSKPVPATKRDKMLIPLRLTALQSLNHGGILQLTLIGDPHSHHFPSIGP
jgi:hypothetical protein